MSNFNPICQRASFLASLAIKSMRKSLLDPLLLAPGFVCTWLCIWRINFREFNPSYGTSAYNFISRLRLPCTQRSSPAKVKEEHKKLVSYALWIAATGGRPRVCMLIVPYTIKMSKIYMFDFL